MISIIIPCHNHGRYLVDCLVSIMGGTTPYCRMLGLEGIKGQGLGLDDDWAYRIVRQVGNYAEVFERNVGSGSPLKIERGLNALWRDGGLQYAPPIR